MSMGKIIYCSDLVLRIDESEEVTNITEWLMESTEYRPVNPEGCVIRHEMTTLVKLQKLTTYFSFGLNSDVAHILFKFSGETLCDSRRLDSFNHTHNFLLLLLRAKIIS